MKLMAFALTMICTSFAMGAKINFDVGYYSLSAESPTAGKDNVEVSGFGSYSLSGNVPLSLHFELGLGYTVFFSQTLSGDMGYGPDFSVIYFPMSSGSGVKSYESNVYYQEIEKWRPFFYLSFHQRQFQSVQSSYSGFGVGGGVEYQMNPEYSLRGTMRSMSLTGSSSTSMTHMEFLVGIQKHF
jgi:hypothetical protein